MSTTHTRTFALGVWMLLALLLSGCLGARPANHDGISDAPSAPATSAATEDLVAQRAAELARGYRDDADAKVAKAGDAKAAAESDARDAKAKAKALQVAIADQQQAETAGGLRRLIFAGVLALAAAAAIAWYAGPKLGTGVALFGGALIVGALTTSVLAAHVGIVFVVVVLGSLGALIWHFRAHAQAVEHLALNTEHLASQRVAALIGRIRARGPGVLMKISSLLHVHAKAAIPAQPPKPPVA